MSKNLSEHNRDESHRTERDRDKQGHPQGKVESMASRQTGQKFVSDDDIVGRKDYRQVRPWKRQDKEPKFVSDDDIVQRQAG